MKTSNTAKVKIQTAISFQTITHFFVISGHNQPQPMLRFFRQIRQRLLTDNKFSKYLLYAVGEILLVVIGILIALQVDNWNTEKMERRDLEGYLNNIANNVTSDLEQLNELLIYRTVSRKGSRRFMQLIAEDPLPANEILSFFEEYGNHLAIYEVYFNPDKSGFDALKNSGYLGKLHGTDFEKELYRYYAIATQIQQQETSVNTFIEEMEKDLFRDNVMQRLLPLVEKQLSNPGDVSRVREFLIHPSLTGANLRNSHLNTLFKDYKTLDASGRQLLSLIEEY